MPVDHCADEQVDDMAKEVVQLLWTRDQAV